MIKSAAVAACNVAACKAILETLYQSGIDVAFVSADAQVEVDVFFNDVLGNTNPARFHSLTVRRVDLIEDSGAQGWFDPGDQIP